MSAAAAPPAATGHPADGADRQRQDRGGDGSVAPLPRRTDQRRFGAGLSRHGHRYGQARCADAGRISAPLIDLISPQEAYSAARFRIDALAAMAEITARGRVPLLVGGTMLYFKALVEGLVDLPPADPATRAAIDREAAARGWPALHAELAELDPLTAARLQPTDAQRIQRALEVWRLSGRRLSAIIASGEKTVPQYRFASIGLAAVRP
jgi:tRNA dimethylallyltransferase